MRHGLTTHQEGYVSPACCLNVSQRVPWICSHVTATCGYCLLLSTICYQKELFISGGICNPPIFLNLLLGLSNFANQFLCSTVHKTRTRHSNCKHAFTDSVVPAALPFACCTRIGVAATAPRALWLFFPSKQECWLRFLGVAVASSLDAVFACDAATPETSFVSSLLSSRS
jgi:hypothetical protein